MYPNVKYLIPILLIFLIFSLVSCNDDPIEATTGILVVTVTDNDTAQTPVADVEVDITPGNFVMLTDENGICDFELDPGAYVVNADVCCV